MRHTVIYVVELLSQLHFVVIVKPTWSGPEISKWIRQGDAKKKKKAGD